VLALLALATTGCARSEAGAERTTPIATWTAELPGRAEPLVVTLPAHLDSFLPRARSEYVLRASVDVPPEMRGRPLTLAVAHMPALARLTADGNEAVPVDASVFDTYRATGPLRWRIPEDASKDGRLELEMRVSHRFTRSAWIDAVPELTTDLRGGRTIARVHAFNTAAATGALTAAIVVAILYGFLFLSLRGRRRNAYGWFALGATCGMAYPAFVLGLTQPVFGTFEPTFMMLSLVLGSIAAMCFTRAYAEQPAPSRAWWGMLAVIVVVGSVLARNPFVSILLMGPIVVAVTIANSIAQLAFVARLRRDAAKVSKRPPLAIYAIAFAWPATVLLGLPDILAWLGQGEPSSGIRTACLGVMALSLYQATALSREHLVSLKRADELNADLEERVKLLEAKHREVELLNDELRRQIAARSRELAEKLASMEEGFGDEAPLPEMSPGDLIEGRYRIVTPLGSGGMGTVYEVERVADGKHFALKALASGGDAQARARFAREAQIVANVKHPNVVSIVDVDVAKSGFIFLVMELVEGGTTLHDVRKRHRDVPWTLGVLAQVADGIDAVHAAGIIHRDLKPGNILLARGEDGRKPSVKITDFGISSLQPERMSVRDLTAFPRPPSSGFAAGSPLDTSGIPAGGSASPEGLPAIRISDLEAARAAGGATPSATGMLVDLEYDPEGAADTAMDVGRGRADDVELDVDEDAATKQDGRGARAAIGSERPPRSNASDRPRTPSNAPKRTPDTPLTETGLIFGTPQYMAQELTAGTRNATRASDVFSLGIIAFEVLVGRRPFPEAPVSAKLEGRALPAAAPFAEACPTLPAELSALLDRAVSHDPRARPTAKELAAALRAAADALAPR